MEGETVRKREREREGERGSEGKEEREGDRGRGREEGKRETGKERAGEREKGKAGRAVLTSCFFFFLIGAKLNFFPLTSTFFPQFYSSLKFFQSVFYSSSREVEKNKDNSGSVVDLKFCSDLFDVSIVEVDPASDPGLEEEGGVMSAIVTHHAH